MVVVGMEKMKREGSQGGLLPSLSAHSLEGGRRRMEAAISIRGGDRWFGEGTGEVGDVFFSLVNHNDQWICPKEYD